MMSDKWPDERIDKVYGAGTLGAMWVRELRDEVDALRARLVEASRWEVVDGTQQVLVPGEGMIEFGDNWIQWRGGVYQYNDIPEGYAICRLAVLRGSKMPKQIERKLICSS